MSFLTKGGRTWQSGLGTAFFLGFMLGIALICLKYQDIVWNTAFLDRESFVRISQLEINKNGLFFYCLQNRLELLVFLLLLSAVRAAAAAVLLFTGWSGCTAGIVLTVLSIRYGIKGIFLFCGCILPQQIFLIPGCLFLMDWCWNKKNRKMLWTSILMILSGCLLEAYVNPSFLKLILRIFPV